jgi:hypothetical protein
MKNLSLEKLASYPNQNYEKPSPLELQLLLFIHFVLKPL